MLEILQDKGVSSVVQAALFFLFVFVISTVYAAFLVTFL